VAAAELVALLATGLFAGAAVYVTFVEHPARVEGGAALALAQFRPSSYGPNIRPSHTLYTDRGEAR
jgi:hypothetical protein